MSSKVAYKYAAHARQHRFRFLFDPLRLLNQGDFIKRYTTGGNPFPLSVEIDPSNGCNHDCGFCIYHSLHGTGRSERLPQARLTSLVDELLELGCRSLLFVGGGEPMTHPGTVAAIERAAAGGISCGLVTNGSLVNAEASRRLRRCATYVRFSFDAATAETHHRLHGRNDFDIVLGNLRTLAKADGPATVGTSFFVNEQNAGEIGGNSALVQEAGADYIQIKTYSGLALSAEVHQRTIEQIGRALDNARPGFEIHVAERIFENHPYQVRGYSRCHFQAMKTIIGADGSVFLCAQMRGERKGVVGNVHQSSLKEIWEGERRREVVEGIDLEACPYCVHDRQNQMLEYFQYFSAPHRDFY